MKNNTHGQGDRMLFNSLISDMNRACRNVWHLAYKRLLPLVSIACFALFLTACDKKESAPPPLPPEVQFVTVQPEEALIWHEWIGVVDGSINATIRPQVTGYLVRQNYQEGEFVKKGQVLFEIDSQTFEATVSEAKAARDRQQAIHANAVATLARVKPLVEKSALSRKDLDDAISQELSARSALDQANAVLKTAELNKGFTKIVSPIDGIAGIAKAQVGDLLSPNSQVELTTVSQINPAKVLINVSEREYLAFQRDDQSVKPKNVELELILSNGQIFPHKGKFALFDRQVNPGTGTFKAGAYFDNPEGRLRPGQFARLRVPIFIKKDAILVLQRAVLEMQGRYLIGVIKDDNTVDIRSVKISNRIGSKVIISEGLNPGERVIIEGIQKIRPGSPVTPKAFVEAAPPSADDLKKAGEKQADKPAGMKE